MEYKIKKLNINEFPKSLLEIPQPPKELYLVGDLPDEYCVFLAVVGSRKFSNYGTEVCEKLFSGLKGYPIVIVSGLALGIDTIAHKLALENNLKTMAIPGSGLDPDFIYPAENYQLAKKIIKSGGCLLSEFEPKFRATTWSFPQRNRLMAGISRGVLVIEAEKKSGSLITAKLATEYNRDVFTIPGSIFSKTSTGTNFLLRQGATPITNSEELLEALGFENTNKEIINEKILEDCSPDEKKILELLTSPLSRDELIRSLEWPITKINSIISLMELKGLIKEEAGEIFRF